MNELQIKEYFDLMEKHIALYSELKEFELEKMKDIAENHYEKLDEHVKAEEAYVLRVRGMEVNREKFFEEVGISGKKMREIIADLPDEYKDEGKRLYMTLSDLVTDVECINRKCMFMSEIRIHRLTNNIAHLEELKKAAKDKNANSPKKKSGGSNSLSAKV